MALNPYTKLNWQNAPSQATPINATNLNKMDDQIYDITDHLINLNAGQLSYSNTVSELNGQTPQAAIDELAKPAFTEAVSRANIASGEKLATILGKIKKYFTDLKAVAFSGSYNDLSNLPALKTVATSGSYNDLSNKPTIPTNTNQLTNGAGYITSAGSCASATSAEKLIAYGSTYVYRKPNMGNWQGSNVYEASSVGSHLFYADSNWGYLHAAGYTTESSRRYKTNISPMSDEDGLSLLKLAPVTFDYIEGYAEEDGKGCKGFIAEDVAEIDDFTVKRNAEGEPDAIDYAKFTPQLIKLCQIQQRQIDDLTKRIEALEGR